MKKAMLFIVALMFSVGVNAATLTLSKEAVGFASQDVDVSSGSVVLGGGTVSEGPGTWFSSFNLKSDTNTAVKVEWSFNPQANLNFGTLVFGAFGGPYTYIDITGDTSFTAILTAGVEYVLDIVDATRDVFKYDVSVSAVPVPAALFLFAPALLGFLGLRRKSAVAA